MNKIPTMTPKKAILLPCPKCGEASANIAVCLGSLESADTELFRCLECEADFGTDDVRDFIHRWARVLAWVDAVPQDEPEGQP